MTTLNGGLSLDISYDRKVRKFSSFMVVLVPEPADVAQGDALLPEPADLELLREDDLVVLGPDVD